MYVVIEKNTGKIVWTGWRPDDSGEEFAVVGAREFAKKNPGKGYYAAFLYLEVVTGEAVEKTTWETESD